MFADDLLHLFNCPKRCEQVEAVEFIPEAKVIMMNGKFYIVKESGEEIIEKTIEYNGKIRSYVNK